jgi:Dimethyladenosine transferase (rRNA methylation)
MILKVPKKSFEPAPKVDSAVIKLVPRPELYPVKSEEFFFDVTKAIFSQRRKKIKNTLLGSELNQIPNLKEILRDLEHQIFDGPAEFKTSGKTVGKVLSMRAEELSPPEIARFSNLLYEKIEEADR